MEKLFIAVAAVVVMAGCSTTQQIVQVQVQAQAPIASYLPTLCESSLEGASEEQLQGMFGGALNREQSSGFTVLHYRISKAVNSKVTDKDVVVLMQGGRAMQVFCRQKITL